MANHPNRNWRRRWQIQPDLHHATHVSGFEAWYRRDERGDTTLVYEGSAKARVFYEAAGDRRVDLRLKRLEVEARMLFEAAHATADQNVLQTAQRGRISA